MKKKAEIMLNDWMKVNPTWEEKEKAEYLAAKASAAENKWKRYDKMVFVQNKLESFIRIMRGEEEMKAAINNIPQKQ